MMDLLDAKIRVIAVAISDGSREELEKACKEKIEEWQEKHKSAISELKEAERSKFYELANQAEAPEEIALIMSDSLIVSDSDEHLEKHLYAADEGCPIGDDFFDSEWEREIVDKELEEESLVAWYRNRRGGNNAISVPYSEGGQMKSVHPDLVFVHEVDGKYVVDLVDPHGPHLSDTSPKWVGLADYAVKHSASYRSVKAVIKQDDKLLALELKDKGIRDEIKEATNETEIRKLFKTKGKDY